jgi:hypothetical protein
MIRDNSVIAIAIVPRLGTVARDHSCDIAFSSLSATYRLAAIDPVRGLAEAGKDTFDARGVVMEGAKLLLVFLITLLIGQSISIGAGLLVGASRAEK